MDRRTKYAETRTFIYYNRNPKNRVTGDCLIRALSTALDIEYERVLLELAAVSLKTGYSLGDNKNINRYMEYKGWKRCKQPRKIDGTKYTGEDFCDFLSVNFGNGEAGNIACNIGGHHIVAIKPTWHGDGINCRYKIHDIWNSANGCIGSVWVKKDVDIESKIEWWVK